MVSSEQQAATNEFIFTTIRTKVFAALVLLPLFMVSSHSQARYLSSLSSFFTTGQPAMTYLIIDGSPGSGLSILQHEQPLRLPVVSSLPLFLVFSYLAFSDDATLQSS